MGSTASEINKNKIPDNEAGPSLSKDNVALKRKLVDDKDTAFVEAVGAIKTKPEVNIGSNRNEGVVEKPDPGGGDCKKKSTSPGPDKAKESTCEEMGDIPDKFEAVTEKDLSKTKAQLQQKEVCPEIEESDCIEMDVKSNESEKESKKMSSETKMDVKPNESEKESEKMSSETEMDVNPDESEKEKAKTSSEIEVQPQPEKDTDEIEEVDCIEMDVIPNQSEMEVEKTSSETADDPQPEKANVKIDENNLSTEMDINTDKSEIATEKTSSSETEIEQEKTTNETPPIVNAASESNKPDLVVLDKNDCEEQSAGLEIDFSNEKPKVDVVTGEALEEASNEDPMNQNVIARDDDDCKNDTKKIVSKEQSTINIDSSLEESQEDVILLEDDDFDMLEIPPVSDIRKEQDNASKNISETVLHESVRTATDTNDVEQSSKVDDTDKVVPTSSITVSAKKNDEDDIIVLEDDDFEMIEQVALKAAETKDDVEIESQENINESDSRCSETDAAVQSIIDSYESNLMPGIKTSTSDLEKISQEAAVPMTVDTTIPMPSQTVETNSKMSTEVAIQKKVRLKNAATPISCVNFNCKHFSEDFTDAPMFVTSYYKANMLKKSHYVCSFCFDECVVGYNDLCDILLNEQPIYFQKMPSGNEVVELDDSSEDEDDDLPKRQKCILPVEARELYANEVDDVISEVFNDINVDKQLKWAQSMFKTKIENNRMTLDSLESDLKELRVSSSAMYRDLYKNTNGVQVLSTLDISQHDDDFIASPPLPTNNVLEYPLFGANDFFYGIRQGVKHSWSPCVIDPSVKLAPGVFRVKFLKHNGCNNLAKNHFAYGRPHEYRLPVGTRVVAYFNPTNAKIDGDFCYYSGIVAETITYENNGRYLIFFDTGEAYYVNHSRVRLVCKANPNVWEELPKYLRQFTEQYLSDYQSTRTMIRAHINMNVRIEVSGNWMEGQISAVDCSIVRVTVKTKKTFIWLYRGSRRFKLVMDTIGSTIDTRQNNNSFQFVNKPLDEIPYRPDVPAPHRAVAKKSGSSAHKNIARPVVANTPPQAATAQPNKKRPKAVDSNINMNRSEIIVEDETNQGCIVYYQVRQKLRSNKFTRHNVCTPACNPVYDMKSVMSYGTLTRPMLVGWSRRKEFPKNLGPKRTPFVIYRAPCGRCLRNMAEVLDYIRETKCPFNVESFDFNHAFSCLTKFKSNPLCLRKNDISNGLEDLGIELINLYDRTVPPPSEYSNVRLPTEGVTLNTDPEFLAGCDCKDECSNKSKCKCHQLTVKGARYFHKRKELGKIGYNYKRLVEHLPTGIYECNVNCKCSKKCLNRVVQHPIEHKLQVFKTTNRGWGLRCVDEIPKGAFVCVYSGELLTEQHANADGKDTGDEYFAELDFIETAESYKSGYEPSVNDPDDEMEDDKHEPDDDWTGGHQLNADDEYESNIRSKLRRRKPKISFDPKPVEAPPPPVEKRRDSLVEQDNVSVREMFGKNERIYVMDAKVTGNVGRYFNHSCSPNLYVQSVFVDTHDLRFPWVAFFSLMDIKPGTELTWNYCYEVNSVPGKYLFCNCGAKNCCKRLL